MSEIAYRPATPGDLEPLLQLWWALQAVGEKSDPRYASAADAIEVYRPYAADLWFDRAHPFPPVWVAESGTLVGYISGVEVHALAIMDQPRMARVHDMYVADEWRGHGIATSLVRRWREAAQEVGVAWFEVGTLATDARAVGFWRAQGFGDWKVVMLRTEPR